MKLTPQERHLVARMAPGVLCAEGFLGTDSRPLADILAADDRAVESLGLTHAQIAAALAEVIRTAQEALGTTAKISRHLSAVSEDAMGPIPCPWGGCGVFAKGHVELTDSRTGRTLLVTPLSVHLIERHGFYQGRGGRYRLEPAELARMLDISGTSDST